MSALAHFIEEAGVPTTGISLIRNHTAKIKPPRALWVPFELGRPLGIPNDPAFQTRVLRACLKLFESKKGPVLMDFTEEVPLIPEQEEQGACPIHFAQPKRTDLTVAEQLVAAFKGEALQLQPWYDLAFKKNGRTTVGVSGIESTELADFLGSFLTAEPSNPRIDITLAETLKLAVEDLKAFYSEAMAAQPGKPPSSKMLSRWFWQQTTAAEVLFAIRDICLKSNDKMMQVVGKVLLIPIRPETER